MLGEPVRAFPLRVDALDREHVLRRLAEPLVVALLTSGEQSPMAVELDPGLASALVDRVLGGEGEGETGGLSSLERGVLAYLFARAASALEPRARLLHVLTSAAALHRALEGEHFVLWPIRVELAGLVGIVRLWLPERAPRVRAMVARGPTAITLRVLAGLATLSAADLASARPSDTLILDRGKLALRSTGPEGEVRVRVGDSTLGFSARLREGRLTMLERWKDEGEPMSDEDTRNFAAQLAVVPTAVVAELASFSVPLGDLAGLVPGEILRTGAPIGSNVSLRVGGRVHARGELVDVEGEIGVRITEVVGRL
jgi:type III secretion protein Q